jgi:5-methylcytosine-specific restriction protein A
MPNIPKNQPKRPWVAQRKVFEGRIQSPFYWSTAWRRLRASYIRRYPLCAHCLQQGRNTPTQEIDHIKPINPLDAFDTRDGQYGNPLDEDNLQPLCKSCHAKKTGSKEYEVRSKK